MRRVIVSSIFLPVLIIGLSCVNLCGAKAKWTFIVYSAEDNSAGSVFDKNQLTTAAVNSSDVNVIVLADENGAENTYIYKVQYDSNTFTVITPTLSVTSLLPAATTNELNTGDPATLVVFSTWAITNYPAEKYCLVLRDQGRETGGWWPKSSELKRAIAWDETADNDYITSQELSDALQKIKIFLGANIDILGFDASYMSQIEVAYQIKDSVNYMAASEEYASGWPYNEILKELVSNPDFDSKTFAQKITEIWDKAYSVKKDAAYTVFDKRTAAATDLSKTGVLAGAVNTFANELIAAKKIVPLYLVRNIIDYYGEDKNDKFGGVDLYDLAYVVRQDSDLTAASLKNAAAAVMNSLEHTVIKNMVGKGHKNSHGLSINFPKTKQAWQNLNNPDDNYENLSFCQATSWNEFLTDYYSKVTYGPQALNYVVPAPNPYDPAVGNLTIINFPDNSSINLKIYNLEGTLVRKTEGSGNSIVWDGRNENGAVVASGIYFYVAHTERDYCKGKITVIKK